MSIKTTAQKNVKTLTKTEQQQLKGGATDGIINGDITLV